MPMLFLLPLIFVGAFLRSLRPTSRSKFEFFENRARRTEAETFYRPIGVASQVCELCARKCTPPFCR
jgi:hypothetical protein